jgi:hypothetical protein
MGTTTGSEGGERATGDQRSEPVERSLVERLRYFVRQGFNVGNVLAEAAEVISAMLVALQATDKLIRNGGVVPIKGETWKQVRAAIEGATGRADRGQTAAEPEDVEYDIQQTIDGEWMTPTETEFYRACCDCGLTHREEYRVHEGKVQYRVWRDREETAKERERTGKIPAQLAPLKAIADEMAIADAQGYAPPDERMLMFASSGGGTFLGLMWGDLRKVAALSEPGSPVVTPSATKRELSP